jgi:hypothetical protein
MQTKHLFLLPALAFLACAGLHAQVTIGGLTEPKPGTILDLNSDVKGGLILSNVHLDNLFEIPSTFPGANGADPIALKAGLKGAVIYNTKPATCVGVHVWDGTYWERITSETPATAPGTTLSITSGSANPLGGDNIVFTSTTPDALTYKWYESKNGAPYEYIAVTPTGTFSKTYTPGSYKVKVITDNCRLEESNDVFIAPETLSPNFGSIAGGNIIYVYGDFDYVPLSAYEHGNALVAHFDGINNQGKGDRGHDFNATSWKDLKNPTFELPKTGDGQWLSNGFQAHDNDTSFFRNEIPSTYPTGNNPRTVEVIFRTPIQEHMFAMGVDRRIFEYGESLPYSMFGVMYRAVQNSGICGGGNPWVFYPIAGNTCNMMSCLSSTPSLTMPDTINTVTSTYQESMNNALTDSYINNTHATIYSRPACSLATTQTGHVWIGKDLEYSTFLSVRLYNRVLNSTEIEENARLDQIRYLTPPEVKIDNVACTEVVVLSPHFLMCRVPASPLGSTGAKDVYVNGVTYSGAYTYVGTSDFYVSSITPILGSAEDELTLTGNRLDEISELKVGDIPCSPSEPPSSGEYKCLIPDDQTGEVGITITTTGGQIYRFAKVFEYQ